VGLVVSQGFRAVIKPESWAASRAADRMVRVAGLPPATPSASEEKPSALGGEGAS
jgi:hypothetical protein